MQNVISKSAFLARKKLGAVLRVFEKKEERVPERVKMARKTYDALRKITYNRNGESSIFNLINEVVFVVWSDTRYSDCDCGKTAKAIEEEFKGEKGVKVLEVKNGGIFCDCLNEGVFNLFERGCSHAMTFSTEAENYLNKETVDIMVDAICSGALVTAAAINEIYQSVLEGRISNTFAIWDIKALMLVGGFDSRCEKPIDENHADWKRGFDNKKNEFVWYLKAGVEEIIPLIKLMKKFDFPFIAPIIPFDNEGKMYVTPNDTDLQERNRKKFATKEPRQASHAEVSGVDLSFLQGGVMPGYRKF